MTSNGIKPIRLSDLTRHLEGIVNSAFADQVWVIAEISSITHARSGHCYLELVELDDATRNEVAKLQARIWASEFEGLRAKFEKSTRQSLRKGMEVLVLGRVKYHPVYGLSLHIMDIDAQYTLGALAQKKALALERLRREGLLERNASLPLPTLLRRIALVSSVNAAGFGDFLEHIHEARERYGMQFTLHEATLQGASACASLIGALEEIAGKRETYDAVVIIRGGGSTLDLGVFDEYALARQIALMPLPVLTGIGHDRDVSLADLAAHRHFKTPTAVAAFVADRFDEQLRMVQALANRAQRTLEQRLVREQSTFDLTCERTIRRICLSMNGLQSALQQRTRISYAARVMVERQTLHLQKLSVRAGHSLTAKLERQAHELDRYEQTLQAHDPEATLRRGYVRIEHEGKHMTQAQMVKAGMRLRLHFWDGAREAEVLGDEGQK